MLDLLTDIENYKSLMTITQVIKFFKSYDIIFTKTMIQNYVRTEVIPHPIEQRYYTRNHLVLLSIIYELKICFSLDEIKTALDKIDGSDLENFYKELLSFTGKLTTSFEKNLSRLSKISNVNDDVIKMGIMIHSSGLKKKYMS